MVGNLNTRCKDCGRVKSERWKVSLSVSYRLVWGKGEAMLKGKYEFYEFGMIGYDLFLD